MRFFRSLFVVVFAVVLGAILFAADVPAAAGGTDWLMAILKGGALGVAATLVGWLKNVDPGKFDFKGLALKVPVGFVVGLIAAYKGISFEAAMDYAVGIGLVTIIDQVVKLLLRRAADAWGWEILSEQSATKKAAGLLIAASCLLCSGCFEAPAPVRDNSKIEKTLWQRYAVRTQKAIETRDNDIRKLGDRYSERLFQEDLAELKKITDANGNAPAERVKAWVLESVAQKDARKAKLEAGIAEQDAKIAEDQALVNAALGLHDKGQEWLESGVDSSAVDGLLDLAGGLAVPKPKASEFGGKP